ncbi:MAG: methyltransferase domain-containing protein [Bdellovibrionales bacterium]|nr:methyltransferase domain-containing protein [Bdellovibrionales bacterium]
MESMENQKSSKAQSICAPQEFSSTFAKIFSEPGAANLMAQMIAFAPVVFQVAKCLRDFKILAILGERSHTFDELKNKSDLSEYGLSLLLDSGESAGIVKKENGEWSTTLIGQMIQSDPLTNVNMNFTHDVCYQALFNLDEAIQTGKPSGLKVFGDWDTVYSGLTQLPPNVLKSWLEFDHFFSDDAFNAALRVLFTMNPKRVLDVGGNTGKFSVACTKFNKDVNVTILDHPNQVKLALANAAKNNVADRITAQGMNLLDHTQAFPKGYDIIWMSQFLDCFSEDDILQLMLRAKAAMNENTRFVIMEPFTDNQRHEVSKFVLDMTSPYFTAVANGNSRMYPIATFYKLIEKAGLVIEEEYRVRLSQSILKIRLAH